MALLTWLWKLNGSIRRGARRKGRRRPPTQRLVLERLEDRTLLAANLTIIQGASGSGTQDSNLLADGQVLFNDSDIGANTLSTGALAAVGSTTNIAVQATQTISFNDLGGTLSLQTGSGNSVTFSTATSGGGAISFATQGNTLATAGGSLTFSAGTGLTLANLDSGGGDVSLTAGADTAGNLSARNILTASSGNITLQATNAGGTVTQTGSTTGQAINVTATGNVTVDSMRGTTVTLTSNTGAINSTGSNPIQASAQLTLSAATGITVNTLATTLQATNSTSGDISITQAASPQQALTTAGTGVRNLVSGGLVSIINLGNTITVASGAPVLSNNGEITLAATDFTLQGAVNSGTNRTNLTNSTAGRQFDLGTDTAGKIGLTSAEIDNVTAGTLRIGSGNAGAITISANIAPAGTNTLSLINAGNVTQAGTITENNLRVDSGGMVSLDAGNDVDVLAGAGGNGFAFTDIDDLIIGTVDFQPGVVASNASAITIIADNLDIQQQIGTAGSVTLRPFTSTAVIDVGGPDVAGSPPHLGLTDTELGRVSAGSLRIGETFNTGGLTVSSAITRHAGYDTLALVNSGPITQSAPLSVANLDVLSNDTVTLSDAGNDVDTLAGFAGGSHNFSYSDANALTIGSVVFDVGVNVGNDVALTTGGALTINQQIVSVTTSVTLTAGGAVTEGANGQIVSPNLLLLGTGPYTLTNPGNDVNTLAANVTGAVSYTDFDDLTIGSVGGTNGVVTTNSAIAIATVDGALTVSDTRAGADVDAGNSTVALTAGSAMGQDRALTLNANAGVSGTGGVTLTADNMSLGAAVNAGTAIAALRPFATNTLINLGGADAANTLGLTDAELDFVTAGVIVVGSTAGDLTVTAQITPANSNQLELVTGAGILDGNTTGADLVVTRLGLTASTGIGVSGGDIRLDVSVSNLEALTDTGGIDIANTGGTLSLGGVNGTLTGIRVNTSGNIRIENNATIQLTDDDGLETVLGGSMSGDVTLLATGATSDVTSTVDEDAISAPRGSIFVTAGHDILFGAVGIDHDNDVRASNDVTFSAGRNITIDGFADVASDDFGQGTGGSVFFTAGTGGVSGNINITNNNGDDASVGANGNSGGDVTLTVMALNGFLNLTAPFSNALFSNSGNVTVNADQVMIATGVNGSGITANNGIVTIQQFSAAHPIDLGTAADTAGTLGLSDAELDRIFTPTLRIGDAANAGSITVSAAITGTTYTTLHLRTGGGIVDGDATAGDPTIVTVNDLALEAAIGIGSADDLDTAVSNLAASNTGGNVQVANTGSLTLPVGGVDGLVGVTNTAAGNIFLSAASPIVVDSAVSDTGGGNITLVTSGADGSITVTTNGSITASGGNGNILLDTSAGTSGQSAILINDGPNAADLSASGTGNITLRSNDAVTLGANAVLQSGLAASGGGTITLQSNFNDVNGTDNIVLGANSQILTRGSIVLNADPDGNGVGGAIVLGAGSFLGAPGGGLANTIILIAAGDITLSDLRATNLVSVTSTGGAIIDGNDPPTGTNNITAATVNLNAATGIGSVPNPNDPMATAADAPIEITASMLSFSNSTSGDVQIVNLSGDLSASGSNSASGGTINLTVQNGNTLTVNASNISSNNGDITLSADDMTITGTVNAGTAIVTLQQAGTTTQNIDLGTNSAGNLGLTDAELGQVTASILRIGRTDNGGSISVTAPITTHAGYDTLSLRTGGGGILEPNAGLAPAIQVTNLAATSNGGGIILNGLNQVSTVALSSGGGGIDFLNSLDLSIGSVDGLNGVDSGGGGITLATVNGNITVTNTPAAIDVNGSGVSITASTTAAHTFTNSAGAAVSGASVSITATNMDLQAGSSVTSLGRTTLAPPSFVPIAIDLGGADGATTLGLTAAELNTVTASTLQIGNGNSGSITVTAAIAPTNVPTLDLETGGGISESAAGDTITVPNLAIRAVNAVTLDQANDVTTGALAANVSGANQSFNFTDANDLTIGTADGLMGITTNGGTIVVTTTNGNLTVNNNVSAGAANINLIAGGTDSTFTNNAVISNSGGLQITVIADRMALNGTPGTSAFTADNGGDVILEPFSAGRLINLGSTTDTAANTLELSNAELGTVTTASAIVIGNASAGDVTVSAPISINSAQVPALEIQTGGGVTNNPTTATLTVTDLDVQAGNAVNLTGANAVSGALAGVVSNAGQGFTFNNAAALDINSAGGINGITTNGGTITVSTTNGDLTVDQAVAAGAAAVNLTAGCNPGADNLLMNNNAITGNSATLTADRMALDDGTINVGTGATNIVTLQPCTVGRPVNLDNAAGDPNGELRLSDAELDTVTAGILRVGNSSAGALTVKSAITDSGSYANLSLLSAGNITETGTGSLSVPAPGGLAAQGSVVNLNSANNAIVNVAGIATGNATPAFNLVTSTSLNVVTVDGVSGIQATNATSSGISLSDTAANTAITVSQPVVATNGDITFTFDNMAFLAAVNAGTRRVTLQPFSSGQLIDLGGNDAAGTLGLSDAELDRVTAGTLQVGMSLSGDITVSNTIDAESHYGTLSLATGGGIVEMTNGKLQVTNLALQAAAGIGSAVALATQATNLAASN
ncbi:MAG: hypothetical protein HYS12_27160, partial [Planctomycetes bacterium]|nr:hypothetical protein [Planctomycetota bacterium]